MTKEELMYVEKLEEKCVLGEQVYQLLRAQKEALQKEITSVRDELVKIAALCNTKLDDSFTAENVTEAVRSTISTLNFLKARCGYERIVIPTQK